MTIDCTKKPPAIGVSVSESPDMGSLGLSDRHLHDAMAEIALQVLASGKSLAYGGDPRPHGFTRFLAEIVGRYRDHPRHGGTIMVTDYLAWPVHIRMTPEDLDSFSTEHADTCLVLLALDGTRLEQEQRMKLCTHEPDKKEWSKGLTTMRIAISREIKARVVLGGKVDGYKGTMPGIAEEAYLSLKAGQPLFLAGGFGGCTRDIAETVGLVERWAGSRGDWTGRKRFRNYTPDALHNGLSLYENAVLARTPHIQEAVTLVTRGLRRILDNGERCAQDIH